MLPFTFWMQLRESYPQFAQQNNQGVYMQQDAEECWTQLLYSLRERLKVLSHPGACLLVPAAVRDKRSYRPHPSKGAATFVPAGQQHRGGNRL